MKSASINSATVPQDYTTVTEIGGAEASEEQIARAAQRYYWAGTYCRDCDVLEIACGVGQGLGYLAGLARSVHAGDITPALVQKAQAHYGTRIEINEMDALALPFPARSLDVVIIFEALYYLSSSDRFVDECIRVLRPGGHVLVANANKDLYDFNPSPFSTAYHGVIELRALFEPRGFTCEFFGNSPLAKISLRQRVIRPLKKLAVSAGLIPKTMTGKKLLKRLVFGQLKPMPAEIDAATAANVPATPLTPDQPTRDFKVLFMDAKLAS